MELILETREVLIKDFSKCSSNKLNENPYSNVAKTPRLKSWDEGDDESAFLFVAV